MRKVLMVLAVFFIASLYCSYAEETHWAQDDVDFLKENQVFDVVFDENEDLEKRITREEFFALTAVIMNLGEKTHAKEFKDISEIRADLRPYVQNLVDNGIVSGILQNKTDYYLFPKQEITREQVCVILAKALGLYSEGEYKFNDWSEMSSWGKNYISAITKAGIVEGYEDGKFKPFNNVTVGEISKIMASVIKKGYFSESKLELYSGTGNAFLKDEKLLKASFNGPTGLAIYKNKLYVADSNDNALRLIDEGNVKTVAGNADNVDMYNVAIGSFKDGDAQTALLDKPTFITAGLKGIIFTDTNNNLIRYYSNDRVTTYAGVIYGGYNDGKRSVSRFSQPTGIVADSKGNIYISDTNNNVIRKIDRNDNVTTYAGIMNRTGGYKDGTVRNAMFNRPMGLALKDGILYVADCGNQRIRKIEAGVVSTVAGYGKETYDGTTEFIGDFIDGVSDKACFNFPKNVITDDEGNLYVADTGNSAIRKIDSAGNVSTIVGLESDNILQAPIGLLIEEGKLYITDSVMNVIYTYELGGKSI